MKKFLLILLTVFALASCKQEVGLDGVRLSPETIEMRIGDVPQKIYIYLYPSYTTETDINWFSEPEGIVTIDNDGMATAVSEGETEVSIKSRGRKMGSCKVKVLPPVDTNAE